MKKFFKWMLLICTLAICVMVPAKNVNAAVTASGNCGVTGDETSVTWEYDSETKTLKISGNGAIKDHPNWGSTDRSDIEKVEIESGVTAIGEAAFNDCNSLNSVSIPSGVTMIGGNAFQSCTALTGVTIPDGVTSIGLNAFSNCRLLTNVTIPDSVNNIGDSAFSSCKKLTRIDLPSGITSISYATFYECEALTSITIPNGVTSIGNIAFSDCKSLTSITIPNTVTSIDNSAFANCTGLTSITIPSSVTSIGQYSFGGCTSLKEITIKGNELSVCGSEGNGSFEGCKPSAVIFDNSAATDSQLVTMIKNVIAGSVMDTGSLGSIVVLDTKKDGVLSKLNEAGVISDADVKDKITSTLKSQNAYEAEKNAKYAFNDANIEQNTVSEGTPTGPLKSFYEEKMDSLISDISVATNDAKESGGCQKTVYLEGVQALSLSIMKLLKSNPNVNLDMTYTYKGVVYHVVIPAGVATFDESIPWYGPLWLYAHYGQGVSTNVSNNNSNAYVVQNGDSLRKIATKYGMTIEELIKKNPQIKNIDRISIGDKINI